MRRDRGVLDTPWQAVSKGGVKGSLLHGTGHLLGTATVQPPL
jgi:hypothetical protein